MTDDDREDPFESPEWLEYAADARENLVPKIRDSAIVMTDLYSDEPDPKIAIELGYAILLGKPLMIMVGPGQRIPENLRRIADGVLEYGDLTDEKTALRVHAEMDRILKNTERKKKHGK